jgi:hypothetical protein
VSHSPSKLVDETLLTGLLVITAYALTMRVTFAQGIITAIASLALVLSVSIPRLRK